MQAIKQTVPRTAFSAVLTDGSNSNHCIYGPSEYGAYKWAIQVGLSLRWFGVVAGLTMYSEEG